MQIAADNAFQTSYYNLTGGAQNHLVPFVHQPTHLKKLRDFFLKNAAFKAFMSGADKKDERSILTELQIQMFKPGDRIVRNEARERSLFIVVSGMAFGLQGIDYYQSAVGHEPIVFRTGAVIGCKQFLNNDKWNMDLIAQQDETLIAKLSFDSFKKLIETATPTAARLRNRVMR